MPAAALPPNEAKRLKALMDLRILNTEAEATYDAITKLASHIMDTPMSFITIVGDDKQWIKSAHGTSVSETSRDEAFCAHAILDPFHPTIVPDATKDPRFSDNPLVAKSGGFRFYVGEPLVIEGDLPVGTLCTVDTIARPVPTPGQMESLRDLARLVMSHFEMRKMILEVNDAVVRLESQLSESVSYEELNTKCDLLLEKIRARKKRRP